MKTEGKFALYFAPKNCENSELLETAFRDAEETGFYSKRPMIEMTIPSSLDPTLAPPGNVSFVPI